MSASTFNSPIQLYDEQIARFAPFPVLSGVRQRSSSLVNAPSAGQSAASVANQHTGIDIDIDIDIDHDLVDLETVVMPGILSKVLGRRTSLEAGAIHKDAGGKLKITEKGRERRLSAGNWRVRSNSCGSTTPSTTGTGTSETLTSSQAGNNPRQSRTPSPNPDYTEAKIAHRSSLSPLPRIKEHSTVVSSSSPSPKANPHHRNSPLQLRNVTDPSRLVSSGAEEDGEQKEASPTSSSSSSNNSSISHQRARAYAALTGHATQTGTQPSPHALDVLARASLSQPSLTSQLHQRQEKRYQPLGALDPNSLNTSASPSGLRRRTTSNNDNSAMDSAEPAATKHGIAVSAAAHPNKTPRRSRVQSATAIPSPSALAHKVSFNNNLNNSNKNVRQTSHPSPAATPGSRKNRRSLSQENSLVATRIARAFLARELGETAIARRSNTTPSKSWTNTESEQRELWLALHDGVLLCRLLNIIVPSAALYIDKRDVHSAKKQNISNFVTAAKLHLPLQPHEFFEVDALYSGSPSGFERVLHTLCAIAEYVSLKQHGLFQTSVLDASRSVESLLPPADLLAQMRSPSPSLASPLSASSAPTLPYNAELVDVSQPNTSAVVSPLNRRQSIAGSPSVARSPLLSSSNGIKIRSRTTSRPASVVASPATSTDPRVSSPHLSAANDRNIPQHGVYGSNPDKRMCESAVEIMGVVREGEEIPSQTRRAVSERPEDVPRMTVGDSHSAECTPVKRAIERGYGGGRSSSIFSDSDASSSSDLLYQSESGLPRPASRVMRLRQSVGSGSSSAVGAGSDILRGNSPRLVRKRLSTDRPLPVRSHSTSPTPPVSPPQAYIPFPQATPMVRAKTSTGHPTSDIDEESELSSSHETDAPDVPLIRPDFADLANQMPLNPRQHKRWNSEVHEQPVSASRLRQEPLQMRTRHNSFMPASTSAHNIDEDSPRVNGDLRRRGPDRRRSMDSSRQQLVVREPGKMPITYQLGECIGRGQFGSVYRALNIHTGSVVAVKRIRLAGKSEEEANQLQKEVDLLKRLSHPSVVKYEGLVRTEHYINIVMEYVENGSLHNTLAAFGILPEALVASYVVKILEGLSYLHRMQVIHRDLKAANILTTKKGNIKLSDFGVSLQLNAVQNTLESADATGTPNWMAPEVIKLEKSTYASDIWSLACTVVELLTGKPPYANMLAMTAMFKIVEDDMPPFPPGSSPELQDFLYLCFAKDPRHRPTADALFEHAWVKKHWSNHKQTLRAQDSIPFFRRISSEYRRPQFDQQGSPVSTDVPELDRSVSSPRQSTLMFDDASDAGFARDPVKIVEPIECRSRPVGTSASGVGGQDLDVLTSELLRQGKDIETSADVAFLNAEAYPFPQVSATDAQSFQSPISPNAGPSHSFVKTTFSKPIECKLCRKPVKKYAVLCEDCGLICHATCKEFAPTPCDLRSQLLGLSRPPSFAPHSAIASNPTFSVSVPTVEPSPLASPAQFAFHSKFGIGRGRKPKASPSSDEMSLSGDPTSHGSQSPDSPRRSNKAIQLLRTRTASPEAVGYHYARHRPASYASSGSFPRSHGAQASLSGSSDSHPLSARSIREDVSPIPVPALPMLPPPAELQKPLPELKTAIPRPVKHNRTKSSKRISGGGDCIIS